MLTDDEAGAGSGDGRHCGNVRVGDVANVGAARRLRLDERRLHALRRPAFTTMALPVVLLLAKNRTVPDLLAARAST